MEKFPFPDNGGRRRSEDRRISVAADYSPERRSGQDRRNGADRRKNPRA